MYSRQQLEAKCFNVALSYISTKPRTEHEVRSKLDTLFKKYLHKGIAIEDMFDDVVSVVIAQLYEERFIDDENYANTYVAQASSRANPLSKLECTAFLAKKGVKRDIINKALIAYSDDMEQRNIEKIAGKRIKDPSSLKDSAFKAKHLNYFFRRGFSSHLVNSVFSNFI